MKVSKRQQLDGLSSKQVERSRVAHGSNVIVGGNGFSPLTLLVTQFTSPVMIVLLIAGTISYLMHGVSDAIVVWGAVLLNGFLGFYQEFKAEKSLAALEKIVEVTSEVMRAGKRETISVAQVVVGDIVFLKSGDKIPADGIILESSTLSVNESMLTGESGAVTKDSSKEDKVFMGSAVMTGIGIMRVTTIGNNTKMGKIAESLTTTTRTPTKLQQQMTIFAKSLTLVVVGVATLLFLVGLSRGMPLREIFLVSVAVAVSAIPEGLAVTLTVILAVGMQKLLKHKALVRKLLVAETLGKVTILCADKTGTLTTGELKVVKVEGDQTGLAEAAILGNDMADSIEIVAGAWGSKISKIAGWRRSATIPFDSAHKYGASESVNGSEVRLIMRGAPEVILDHCQLDSSEKKQLIKRFEELGSEGYRLITVAEQRQGKLDSAIKSKTWHYLGIIVMEDPIRTRVVEDIAKLTRLGVRFCVITGDFAQTAQYVMKKLGIEVGDKMVIGSDFRQLSSDEQRKVVESSILFARFAPEDKLRVVTILKEQGEVVAMMGDGINDAPALKRSDVGIVVASASEVSKETADMVLLDNRFGTVVAGIEEGRSIFERIKRVVRYLLSDSLSEVVAITTAMMVGIPLPVTAAQILWINLANDTFPAMALAFDPVDSSTMSSTKNHDERFFDWSSKTLVGVVSLVSGLLVVLIFYLSILQGHDVVYARSLAFAFLGINTLFSIFVIRNFSTPLWKINLFDNWYVWGGVGIGVLMQLGALYLPPLQYLLRTVAITASDWVTIALGTLGVLGSIEIIKLILTGILGPGKFQPSKNHIA